MGNTSKTQPSDRRWKQQPGPVYWQGHYNNFICLWFYRKNFIIVPLHLHSFNIFISAAKYLFTAQNEGQFHNDAFWLKVLINDQLSLAPPTMTSPIRMSDDNFNLIISDANPSYWLSITSSEKSRSTGVYFCMLFMQKMSRSLTYISKVQMTFQKYKWNVHNYILHTFIEINMKCEYTHLWTLDYLFVKLYITKSLDFRIFLN